MMRKSRFLKHINQLSEEDLRTELLDLFDQLESVRSYYQMELGSQDDRKKKYQQAKKLILAKYKTKSLRKPRRPRIQKVKKILSELNKLSVFSHEMIDIYLYDVECSLDFIRTYDYFTTVLFNNTRASFEKALQLIEQNLMHDLFKERCIVILDRSRYILELHLALNTNFKKLYSE